MTGTFISFEGPDGSGKSTQVALFAQWARTVGLDTVVTREPGGTDVGRKIREIVLHHAGHVAPMAEVHLFAADRAHHVQTVIKPALADGKVVVTDRYVDSSVAYQGAGHGLGTDLVAKVNETAVDGIYPNLVIILDLNPEEAHARATATAQDRMEANGVGFQHRVRDALLARAAAAPDRYVVLDAAGTKDEVHARVLGAVSNLLDVPVRTAA